MAEKKNYLTREGLRKYEDELQNLKSVRRKEISQKIKEAREQGDLSENAEYDAARDEQRDVEARIEELENILKNVVIMDVEQHDGEIEAVVFGCTVKLKDLQKKGVYRNQAMAGAAIVDAQAEAMKTAAGNANGAAMGFFGMNMAMQAGGANANELLNAGAAAGATGAAPQAGGRWFCPNCGNENNGNFCVNCGTKRP